MLCERCKKREATILYREFGMNGERTELHLCESCARKMNIGGDFGDSDDTLSLGVMLSAIFTGQSEERKTDYDRVVCPDCKTRYSDFVRDSRFGCPTCYEVFDVLMRDNIKQLQGSDMHKGKHPKYGLRIRPTAEAQDMAVNEGSEKDASVSPVTSPEVERRIQICGLRVKLNAAIRAEDYTKAAEIRDQIRLLEKEDTDA